MHINLFVCTIRVKLRAMLKRVLVYLSPYLSSKYDIDY